MATLFLDLENGNNANSGADFANRFKTLSAGATAARTAPGDVVRLMASRQGDIGSKSWTNGTRTITGSIPVKNIDLCDSNTGWTVSSNVTLNANSTTRKEGTGSISITFASGFTTGKVIYKALGASTDFSAYQQVCLWIRSSSAQSANRFRVCLCSDTTGDTVVDNLTIPFAIDPTNTWHAVVLDKGSALGSAIQSIAIYADSDPATPTILIDDIIAAKAPSASDCITLHTLISKANTVASWTSKTGHRLYAIGALTESAIEIDNSGTNASTGSSRTYDGTTESVTTYTVQAIPHSTLTNSATGEIDAFQESGASGSRITYSGGWNRTDMSTQDGVTAWCAVNGTGHLFGRDDSSISYLTLERLIGVRATEAFYIRGNFWDLTDCLGISNSINAFAIDDANAGSRLTFLRCVGQGAAQEAFSFSSSAAASANDAIDCIAADSNLNTVGQFLAAQIGLRLIGCHANNGAGYGFQFGAVDPAVPRLINCVTTGNAVSAMHCSRHSWYWVRGCTFNESTKITNSGVGSIGDVSRVVSTDHGGVVNTCFIYGQLWSADTSTSTVNAGARSWRIRPTSANISAENPIAALPIVEVACVANKLTTVKLWVRRTNTGLTMRAVVRGYQIAGVDSDVTASAAGSADTWEELTLTFTPTADGVVTVDVQAYGGTTYEGFIDGPITVDIAP